MNITKVELDKTIKMLELNFNLTAREGYADLMFSFLKNNTVNDLRKAYSYFLRQKSISKLPSITQWLEAMGKDTRTPKDIACDNFLAKVKGYLSSGFVSSEDKLEFSKGLSEVERRILSSFGGISVLWQDCHREEYNRNISVLLNQLKKEFDNNATEENIKLPPKDTVSIENKTKTVSQDKIKELLGNSIKRIS